MSNDPVALVTGATSGMGAATAKAYAAAAYRVVLAGRRAEKGAAVADEIVQSGGTAQFVQCDVSDETQVKALLDACIDTYGRLDTAFNNAGIEGDIFVPTHEQRSENYQRVFDVNVRGVLLCMQHEITLMLENGGSIINNASTGGLVGFQGMSIYSASKHAVVGLTRSAALEYADRNIRINAVAPGPVESDMFERFANDEVRQMINAQVPLGRPGTGAEVASAVLWLSDPGNSFTTGQVITVDGGYTAH